MLIVLLAANRGHKESRSQSNGLSELDWVETAWTQQGKLTQVHYGSSSQHWLASHSVLYSCVTWATRERRRGKTETKVWRKREDEYNKKRHVWIKEPQSDEHTKWTNRIIKKKKSGEKRTRNRKRQRRRWEQVGERRGWREWGEKKLKRDRSVGGRWRNAAEAKQQKKSSSYLFIES